MDEQTTPPSDNPQTNPVAPVPQEPLIQPPTTQIVAPQVDTSVPEAGTATPAMPTAGFEPVLTKYPVHRAVLDTIHAIKTNLLTYIISIVLSGVMVLVGVAVLIIPVFTVFFSIAHAGGVSSGTTIGLIIGAIIFAIAWFIVAGAFLITYTALALDAGANGRRSGVGETFRASMGMLKRVVAANLLIAAIAVGPFILAAALGLAFAVHGGPLTVLSFLFALAGMIWVYVALLRYLLAPYVAIFEPEVPISKFLTRSRELMRKGGQWFVIKGAVATILVVLILSFIAGPSLQKLPTPISILLNLVALVVELVASGTVVLLYRNR